MTWILITDARHTTHIGSYTDRIFTIPSLYFVHTGILHACLKGHMMYSAITRVFTLVLMYMDVLFKQYCTTLELYFFIF